MSGEKCEGKGGIVIPKIEIYIIIHTRVLGLLNIHRKGYYPHVAENPVKSQRMYPPVFLTI